jgi:hypothetical protein
MVPEQTQGANSGLSSSSSSSSSPKQILQVRSLFKFGVYEGN